MKVVNASVKRREGGRKGRKGEKSTFNELQSTCFICESPLADMPTLKFSEKKRGV